MRDHQIKAQCEAFAQRGPWGHVIRHKDEETGKTTVTRISFRAALNMMAQGFRDEHFPPQPRASKGISYAQYGHKRADGSIGLGPRRIVVG